MRPVIPFFMIATSFLAGCRPLPAEWPAFDGQRAYAEVEALVAFSPRDAGTPGGRKAAEHILQRLEDFGVEARIDTFTDRTPAGEKTFHNVIGQIPGTNNRWIILGSHFDTMPGIGKFFQGANDSGSSTGVLLELARLLKQLDADPETGIFFAFFDGEEGIANYAPGDGLHGSRHLAAQLLASGTHKNVDAMILLDMVGDHNLHFKIPTNSSRKLTKVVLDAARATGHRDLFSLASSYYITDDHVPFMEIGIPAIDIIDFRFGSKPELNDYWHTDADRLENISAASLETVGQITLEIIRQTAFNSNP